MYRLLATLYRDQLVACHDFVAITDQKFTFPELVVQTTQLAATMTTSDRIALLVQGHLTLDPHDGQTVSLRFKDPESPSRTVSIDVQALVTMLDRLIPPPWLMILDSDAQNSKTLESLILTLPPQTMMIVSQDSDCRRGLMGYLTEQITGSFEFQDFYAGLRNLVSHGQFPEGLRSRVFGDTSLVDSGFEDAELPGPRLNPYLAGVAEDSASSYLADYLHTLSAQACSGSERSALPDPQVLLQFHAALAQGIQVAATEPVAYLTTGIRLSVLDAELRAIVSNMPSSGIHLLAKRYSLESVRGLAQLRITAASRLKGQLYALKPNLKDQVALQRWLANLVEYLTTEGINDGDWANVWWDLVGLQWDSDPVAGLALFARSYWWRAPQHLNFLLTFLQQAFDNVDEHAQNDPDALVAQVEELFLVIDEPEMRSVLIVFCARLLDKLGTAAQERLLQIFEQLLGPVTYEDAPGIESIWRLHAQAAVAAERARQLQPGGQELLEDMRQYGERISDKRARQQLTARLFSCLCRAGTVWHIDTHDIEYNELWLTATLCDLARLNPDPAWYLATQLFADWPPTERLLAAALILEASTTLDFQQRINRIGEVLAQLGEVADAQFCKIAQPLARSLDSLVPEHRLAVLDCAQKLMGHILYRSLPMHLSLPIVTTLMTITEPEGAANLVSELEKIFTESNMHPQAVIPTGLATLKEISSLTLRQRRRLIDLVLEALGWEDYADHYQDHAAQVCAYVIAHYQDLTSEQFTKVIECCRQRVIPLAKSIWNFRLAGMILTSTPDSAYRLISRLDDVVERLSVTIRLFLHYAPEVPIRYLKNLVTELVALASEHKRSRLNQRLLYPAYILLTETYPALSTDLKPLIRFSRLPLSGLMEAAKGLTSTNPIRAMKLVLRAFTRKRATKDVVAKELTKIVEEIAARLTPDNAQEILTLASRLSPQHRSSMKRILLEGCIQVVPELVIAHLEKDLTRIDAIIAAAKLASAFWPHQQDLTKALYLIYLNPADHKDGAVVSAVRQSWAAVVLAYWDPEAAAILLQQAVSTVIGAIQLHDLHDVGLKVVEALLMTNISTNLKQDLCLSLINFLKRELARDTTDRESVSSLLYSYSYAIAPQFPNLALSVAPLITDYWSHLTLLIAIAKHLAQSDSDKAQRLILVAQVESLEELLGQFDSVQTYNLRSRFLTILEELFTAAATVSKEYLAITLHSCVAHARLKGNEIVYLVLSAALTALATLIGTSGVLDLDMALDCMERDFFGERRIIKAAISKKQVVV